MDKSLSYFNNHQSKKTSAEIISEAKAAVSKDSNPEGSSWAIKPVKTKRPFTPRQTDRYFSYDKNFSGSIDGGDYARPLSGIKLEPLLDRPKSSSERQDEKQNNSNGLTKFPSIPLASASIRQQFRLHRVKEEQVEEDIPQVTIYDYFDQLKISESEDEVLELLKKLRGKFEESSEKQVLRETDISDTLRRVSGYPEAAISFIELVLSKTDYNKAHRESLLKICKMIFKISKVDSNDEFFIRHKGENGILSSFLSALGFGDPLQEPEALIYGYGALKFLSMNSKILEELESLGFIDLLVLHLKIIAKNLRGTGDLRQNIQHSVFQMTACLRNALNTKSGRTTLRNVNGFLELETILKFCFEDPDVVCNIARIFSVISADENSCSVFLESHSLIRLTIEALFKYAERSDIVVRLAYCLGNLLGQYEEIRKCMFQQRFENGQPNLFEGLSSILLRYSNEGSGEDVAVKIVRIFANASIDPEAGSEMAVCPSIIDAVLENLKDSDGNKAELLVSSISTLNNLSFYPIVFQNKVYETLVPSYSFHENITVATEAMRVLGNLTRRGEIRNRFVEDGSFIKLLSHLPSNNKDYDYSATGVIVNMMVDSDKRPIFRTSGGLSKSVVILEEGLKEEDFALCTLVCQALWNYSINLDQIGANETEISGLNDILSSIVYSQQPEEKTIDNDSENEEYSDLYSVARGLLFRYKKIIPVSEKAS